MRNGSTRLGTLTPHNRAIGAGGFCTGISIANDGTKMVRLDTFDAYAMAAGTTGTWQHQLTTLGVSDIDLFYGGDPHPWGQPGTYDVAIAPSNSAVRYVVSMGFVFVTQDSGATWTKWNLAQQANCFPNETNRMSGKPLAVDPANPAVCFFGSPNGLFYTADYGVNVTTISTATIPTPTAGKRMCVAFDPNSAVTGGKTQGVYVFVNGTGLRKSTDGGANWTTPTQPTGSPTAACHMKIGSNGNVYLTGDGANDNGPFRRWDGAAWQEPAGISCKTIAISPHNAGHIYKTNAGGGLDVSTDYGATWYFGTNNVSTNVRVATNIGWHEYTNEQYMTNGDMEFDPLVNRIWLAEGIGVWYTDSPPTTYAGGSTTTWVECSLGIENMVTSVLTCASDGTLGYAMHDRGVMVLPKADVGSVFPAVHGGTELFQHGGMVDYAPEDPSFWVGAILASGSLPSTCWSTDRGATWDWNRALVTASGGAGGGNIVALSTTKWLQVQTNRAFPTAGESDKNSIWRTSDAGVTWTKCTIGDGDALDFHQAYGRARRILIGDKTVAGRAFAYNMGDGTGSASDLACKGIWRTDDYGVNWTRVKSTHIINRNADYYAGKFTKGGAAGEWFWCGGDEALGLWRSTDNMATWAEVTGSDDINGAASFGEVFGVGVGKAVHGSSYSTLFVCGWRQASPAGASSSTGYGFWISYDNGATWTRVAQFLGGYFDVVCDIVGDPTRFGTFHIGWGGSGVSTLRYDYTMRLT